MRASRRRNTVSGRPVAARAAAAGTGRGHHHGAAAGRDDDAARGRPADLAGQAVRSGISRGSAARPRAARWSRGNCVRRARRRSRRPGARAAAPDLRRRRRARSRHNKLKLFKLVKGPAVVARFDRLHRRERPRAQPAQRDPDGRRTGARLALLGVGRRIRLVATVPGDIPARVAFAPASACCRRRRTPPWAIGRTRRFRSEARWSGSSG